LAGRSSSLRFAFIAAVAVKGFDGLVETAAGIFVATLGTQGIYSLILQLTAPELDLHPQSRAIHAVRHGAANLAQGSGRFVLIWLLAHGIIKLALAIELLRGKTWIFPVSALILSGFVGYMTYRLAGHWSPWLLAFALFDAVTVALVLNEWRSHRAT
jgi:uncharacterized membrane protein